MQGNEPTLVEVLNDQLLRAGFDHSAESSDLLHRAYESGTTQQRILSLRGLARRQLLDDNFWIEVLATKDVELLREGLALLAKSDDVDGVMSVVSQLLSHADDLVVEAAAFTLGEHFWGEATEELSRVARSHEDPRCRESAVAALGAIGDERARPTILGALDDKAAIRRRAIVALSNYEGSDIEAALDRAEQDRDWQVRSAVDQLRNHDL